MKTITEPSVYLVGFQECWDPGIHQFLADHEVSWETDSDEAEKLCEMAGRVCYMSYSRPRPGGNAAYLKHIKEVGHGSVLEHAVWNFVFTGISRSLSHELVRHRAGWSYCLAGDTVIYGDGKCNGRRQGGGKRTIRDIFNMTKTPHGRSRLKLLRLRCLEGSEFTRTRIAAAQESGVKDLFKVTLEDGKSIRCSADHRFLTPDGWASVRELSAGEVLATNGLPATGLRKEWLEKKYHKEGLMIEDIAKEAGCSPATVAKWIGRFGLSKKVGQGMRGREPWNKGIEYTAGWEHTEETKAVLSEQKKGNKNPAWRGDDAKPQAGRLRAQRLFPTEPCEACGKEEGHRHHKDRNTFNNSRDNIQFLCNRCHKMLHLAEDGPTGTLRVKWVKISSIVPDGREMTYDIEVEHPEHNFVANGFVTHNSQLSQRYVDESVAEYVAPPVIAQDPELLELWKDAVEYSHRAYCRLSALLTSKVQEAAYEKEKACLPLTPPTRADWMKSLSAEERTGMRKEARQAARSVLPNATETKIFATANARALRHTIELRASRHADVEIRKLFVKVWELLVAEAPNLFSDYRKVPLPDGTFELVTDYRKV